MNDREKAEAAKRLIEDPLFDEAFQTLREELLIAWEHSGAQDQVERESAWIGLRILSRLRTHFESLITTGEMEKRKNDIGMM